MRSRVTALTMFVLVLSIIAPGFAAADPTLVVPPTVGEVVDGLPERTVDGELQISEAVVAPIPFSLVGLELPDGAEEGHVRTSADGENWSPWQLLEVDPEEAPDPRSAEAAAARTTMTEPIWVGEARFLQVAVDGASTEDTAVHLVDGLGQSRSLPGKVLDVVKASMSAGSPADASSARPPIITRAQWGANESWRSGSPSYAKPRYAVVHHTATSNDYSREDAAKVVNSMYRYHTQSRGWSDIGYNLIVDRYGRVYEGRYGGVDKGVIGAHAAGFNTESIGVSIIGTMTNSSDLTSAGYGAMVDVLAWKFDIHDIDPSARITVTSRGGSRYPSGTKVTVDTVTGHRDVGKTSCPGDALYRRLPEMRRTLAERVPPPGSEEPPASSVPPEDVPPDDAPPEEAPPASDKEAQPAPGPRPMLASEPFDDTSGTPHAANIERIRKEGITGGCDASSSSYCPTASVSRGQIATFLARVLNLPGVEGQRFEDVPPSHLHAQSINALADAGVAVAFSDGTYRPDKVLTRSEMALLLQRTLGLELVWGQMFSDVPMEEAYYRPRINAISKAGVTEGCNRSGTHYCPDGSVTRGQMATFLVRVMDHGD